MRLRDHLAKLWRLLFPQKRATLLVMRLADMAVVHPDQIESECSRCGETVAVYPSGQAVMAKLPTTLVCEVCASAGERSAPLAPGARIEPFQSRRKETDR